MELEMTLTHENPDEDGYYAIVYTFPIGTEDPCGYQEDTARCVYETIVSEDELKEFAEWMGIPLGDEDIYGLMEHPRFDDFIRDGYEGEAEKAFLEQLDDYDF